MSWIRDKLIRNLAKYDRIDEKKRDYESMTNEEIIMCVLNLIMIKVD